MLQVDLDKTTERLLTTTQQLEEKEKALLAAELEVRRIDDENADPIVDRHQFGADSISMKLRFLVKFMLSLCY